jgi:predicted nucleic acid-binding protein
MTAPVFVDTNVLIHARDAGEPEKQPRAREWLARLWREQAGRTSVQVLSEYYVNVTRKLEPGLTQQEAWDDVQALLTWHPQAIDATLLQRGREIEVRHRLPWWDSLIVAAAQAQGCALLLSEDFHDGAVFGGVTVRSPFTLRVEEREALYAALPSAQSRHRPRGRPPRASR